MDITNLPMISYMFDWKNVGGTNLFGILGVIVCLAACAACWYQIAQEPAD